MHTLVKPDGTEVKVNDKSLNHALSLGWKKKPTKKATPKKKPAKKAE